MRQKIDFLPELDEPINEVDQPQKKRGYLSRKRAETRQIRKALKQRAKRHTNYDQAITGIFNL